MNIISGKKTVLFSLVPAYREYFDELCADKNSLILGTSPDGHRGWLIKTKEGKRTRNVGIIAFTPTSNTSLILQARFDSIFAVDIEPELQKRYTFIEDALITALDYIFSLNGVYRVEIPILPERRISRVVLEKVGFRQEGCMRNAIRMDGKLKDIVIMALVKEETTEALPVSETTAETKEPQIIITEPKPEMTDKQLAVLGITRINRKEG